MNVVAVDGGGTKTELAVISGQGQVLCRVSGGGINPFDQPRWTDVLRSLFGRLTAPFGAVVLALPGYGEAGEVSAQQDAVAASFGVPVRVLNDVEAAHLGAFAGGPGLLILAGTGSMVWAKDARGQQVRVGGWGDLLGDEGSAYWTGREALNSLTRALDGRQPRLDWHDRLLAHLRQDAVLTGSQEDILLPWLISRTHPRSEIAALAQHLDTWASAGDADAVRLLEEAGTELALLALTARRRLPGINAWSLAGSFTRSSTVQQVLKRELRELDFHPGALPPLGGAAYAAATLAGWIPSAQWVTRLASELESFPQFKE